MDDSAHSHTTRSLARRRRRYGAGLEVMVARGAGVWGRGAKGGGAATRRTRAAVHCPGDDVRLCTYRRAALDTATCRRTPTTTLHSAIASSRYVMYSWLRHGLIRACRTPSPSVFLYLFGPRGSSQQTPTPHLRVLGFKVTLTTFSQILRDYKIIYRL